MTNETNNVNFDQDGYNEIMRTIREAQEGWDMRSELRELERDFPLEFAIARTDVWMTVHNY